jgi:hypothetical protein
VTASSPPLRIALVYPVDSLEARRASRPETSRFPKLFAAIAALGAQAEPAAYNDDFAAEVRRQLLSVDAALVWVNPIQNGHDRRVLDALLRDVARAGIFVSTQPDVILKIGTKEVLYETRTMAWGADTRRYASLDELRQSLPASLATGPRVLKQCRGHSGIGVWRVERQAGAPTLRVRHAERGSVEQIMSPDQFMAVCSSYFANGGLMIDQAWQPRLPEGMVRCYLVGSKVEGFGVQEIVALHPAPPGAPPDEAPPPSTRHYHPATLAPYQGLKHKVEHEWLPELQRRMGLSTEQLPALWDMDFLLGPKDSGGRDTYVLCEINVSSVAPFPDSAIEPLARLAIDAAGKSRRQRRL